MTYDDFKSLCEQRRSTRYFGDQPVTQEEVMKLLELAQLAPSVENLQPWHFSVIFDKELRSKLMEASCYGDFIEKAGVFIVVSANTSYVNKAKDVLWNPKELEYSCAAAMEHILLGAAAMGLGGTWVSLHHGAAHELLERPTYEAIVGGLMLGHYKKGEEQPTGGHIRDPLEDAVTLYE